METQSKNTTTHYKQDSSERNVLNHLIGLALDRGYSLALWRLPEENQTHAILSYTAGSVTLDTPFEELSFGFMFYPFSTKKPGVFLKADQHFCFTDGKLCEAATPSESITWYQETVRDNASLPPARIRKQLTNPPPSKTKTDFEDLVLTCIDHIQRGDFEKVVPSRTKTITLPETFDIFEAFQKLCIAYPNALVSLVHTPDYGSWLGATPEVLVSVDDKTTFKTVALAGTQPYTMGTNLRNVAWTQKEIEEQALVSRYIINCFKKIRLREFDEHGPKTIVAGNLMHLKTDFSVDMAITNFPQLGSVMLRLLHPTSAVCGMPMEITSEFLHHHEGYDRSFYSGFLGPINHHNNAFLFVNLRCMQVFSNHAICYAGAGITRDSIPEKEWEETEIKMNTLLKVLG
jgi:isochorismate synthase